MLFDPGEMVFDQWSNVKSQKPPVRPIGPPRRTAVGHGPIGVSGNGSSPDGTGQKALVKTALVKTALVTGPCQNGTDPTRLVKLAVSPALAAAKQSAALLWGRQPHSRTPLVKHC